METLKTVSGLIVLLATFWAMLRVAKWSRDRAEFAPGSCSHCQGSLKAVRKITGAGLLLIVIGLCLTPVLIGFLLVPYGATRRAGKAVCRNCHAVAYEMA